MHSRGALLLLAALMTLLVAAIPASAQTLPANPGDFAVSIDLGGAPAPGAMPDCTPSLTSLGSLFLQGQTSVSAVCKTTDAATQKTTTGTVSNAALAGSTGDAGFNTGTITALCDSTQTTDFTLAVALTGSSLQKFGGTAFYACSFTMAFQDAQKSTLVGTIEVNAKLGSADGSVSGSTIDVKVDGRVYITSGTGLFAGAVGSGTFEQTQTFAIPSMGGGASTGGNTPVPTASATASELAVCSAVGVPSAQCNSSAVAAICQQAGANPSLQPLCAAAGRRLHLRVSTRAGNASAMKLSLKKGSGSVRILAPAPAAGKGGAAASIKASTKVKLAATTGASCTVKASTGAVVGTGTAKGAYGAVTVRPKASAYAGAKWIKATCTKGGKSFSSNTVKVALK